MSFNITLKAPLGLFYCSPSENNTSDLTPHSKNCHDLNISSMPEAQILRKKLFIEL